MGDLPLEIWEEIYKRLVMSDRARLSSVIRISDKAARGYSFPPEAWLMLGHTVPQTITLSKNRFHCLADKRVYRFDNIIPQHDRDILGSSNGWLLIRPHYAHHFDLVNPISNVQISLPTRYSSIRRINKLLVVETRGEASATVIVLTNMARVLVFSDTKCYYQEYAETAASLDITFYKGRIYGLVITQGRFEIHVSQLDTVFEQLYIVRRIAPTRDFNYKEYYLVESGRDLLIVRRGQSDGFEVFKLVISNGFADAIKMQNLGDHALFCGSDGCISLPVREFSPFEGNHVYFVVFCTYRNSCEVCGVSLKDGSIKRISRNLPVLAALTNSFWFVPTTQDITV